MAIIGYRVIYEFSAVGDQNAGWSEQYWQPASTLQSAIAQGLALQPYRLACLSDNVSMPYMRVAAYPGGTRLATILNLLKNPGVSVWGGQAASASNPVAKGLLYLSSTSGQQTHQEFGGIPSSNWGANGAYVPGGGFMSTFNAFLTQLNRLGFCIRKTSETAPFNKQDVTAIAATGAITVPTNGFGTGNLVNLTGMPSGYGLDGVFKVISNDGSNFMLKGLTPPGVAVQPLKKSYAQLYSSGLSPIGVNTTLIAAGFLPSAITRSSKHNVGRPPNPATGRRKVRKK